jgi:hypothetical protein
VTRSPLLLLPALAAGCALAGDDAASVQGELVDGSPESIGVLAFLNSPTTTVTVLDDDVPLDRRAATKLVAHRDGADGVAGTADDDRFDTVREVDDVPYVGETALRALAAYAIANGYVPGDDTVLGTFEGVTFTVGEAARALTIVNNESDGVLDVEVGLDSRAVRNIIAARPIGSIAQLAAVAYVGTTALRLIKDYVAAPAPGTRADCRIAEDCEPGERCTGIPNDESSSYGLCYDPTIPPGAEAPCATTTDCGPGLVCLGQYAFAGDGFCVPAWQHGTFENTVQRWIPADGSVVATGVVVRGLATVPVDIWVHVDTNHSRPHDLRISIRDPNGDVGLLWDGPNTTGSMPSTLVHSCCIPGDDYVNGWWTLLVENVGGHGTGNLYGWTLDIISQWD